MWVNRVVVGSCRSLADFHNAPKADEAGMISARTKAALAAAKRCGVQLGGDRGGRLTAKARKAGNAAVARAAAQRAADWRQ